ncbi:ogr/Delta-like zinc finger family protein [Lelliottia amnigena]
MSLRTHRTSAASRRCCHQCTNIECSSTFRSIESIEEIIRLPPESFKPQTQPDIPMSPRMVKGCYNSPFCHNQEERP